MWFKNRLYSLLDRCRCDLQLNRWNGEIYVQSEAFPNLRRNRIMVRVLHDDLKLARKILSNKNGKLNRGVKLVSVSTFVGIENSTRDGGEDLSVIGVATPAGFSGICTSGFNVESLVLRDVNGAPIQGGTTANHCGRNIKYDGSSRVQQPQGAEASLCEYSVDAFGNPVGLQRSIDLQWFSHPSDDYPNKIEGRNEEVVSVFRQRDYGPVLGFPVCLSGMRTQTSRIPPRTSPTAPVPVSQGCIIPSRPIAAERPSYSGSRETCGVMDTPVSAV